ncbi:MAG: hypothetical protein AABY86_12225, partial [Bdellovibrionota bacterium]
MGMPQFLSFRQIANIFVLLFACNVICEQIAAQTLETNLTPNPWTGNLSVSLNSNAEKWNNEN